jgi:nitroreductase
VLILGVAKTKFSHNDSPNRVALYDLGAAASYLTLQAAALGLSTHQMAGFDAGCRPQGLCSPDDYVFGAVIALGYQGEPARPAQRADSAPRKSLRAPASR